MTSVDVGAAYSGDMWAVFEKLRRVHLSLLGEIISKYCSDVDDITPRRPYDSILSRAWDNIPGKEHLKRPVILEFEQIGISIRQLERAGQRVVFRAAYECRCGKRRVEIDLGAMLDRGTMHLYAGKYQPQRSKKTGKIRYESPVPTEIVEVMTNEIPKGYTLIPEAIIEHNIHRQWERAIGTCLTCFYAEFQPLLPVPIEIPYFNRYGISIPGYGDVSLYSDKAHEFYSIFIPLINYYDDISHRLHYYYFQEELRRDSVAKKRKIMANESILLEETEDPFFQKHESGLRNPSIPYTMGRAARTIGMTGGKASDELKNRVDFHKNERVKLAVKVSGKERKWYFNRDFGDEYKKLALSISCRRYLSDS